MSDALFVVEVLGKLGPTIIAGLVGWTGYQQFRWSRMVSNRQHDLEAQKLRLSLLDRRLDLYARFREIQGELSRHGTCSLDQAREASLIASDAEFLFPPPVVGFLAEFAQLAWDMREQDRMTRLAERDRPRDLEARIIDAAERLGQSYGRAQEVFRPAISIVA